LQTGPWARLSADSTEGRLIQLEQIIKFGIPETDMPGHEYLSDRNISSIARWLNKRMIQPNQIPSSHDPSGENHQ